MTGRRWVLVALSIAVFAYALGQEWLSISYEIIENHLLDVFVGISAAVAGVVALDRRPGNPTGWLLLAIAVAWHADPYVLLGIRSSRCWRPSSGPCTSPCWVTSSWPIRRDACGRVWIAVW